MTWRCATGFGTNPAWTSWRSWRRPPEPTPTVYTVTFDANGGTVDTASMDTGTNGKLTSLPDPTWGHHSLLSWCTEDGTEVDLDTVFTQDTTIYAHWNWRIDRTTKILYIDGYLERSDYIITRDGPGSTITVAHVPWYEEDIENVVMGKTITDLGFSGDDSGYDIGAPGLFYECFGLKNVTIPDSVTSIGRWAFERCSGLTDIHYGGSTADWKNLAKNAMVPAGVMIHTTDNP